MNTLLGHFQHYYKNLGLMAHFIYFLEEYKGSKINQAIRFGQLYQKLVSIPMPTVFVRLHKKIPALSTLPIDQQNHILELDKLLQVVKNIVSPNGLQTTENNLRNKYEEMLINDRQEEIKEMLNMIENLLNVFYAKISELEKFREVYN